MLTSRSATEYEKKSENYVYQSNRVKCLCNVFAILSMWSVHFFSKKLTAITEAPETVRGKGGRLTPEGHEGWSAVWGWVGAKHWTRRRIPLWHCCYCDMWQIQMHIQWCRHQMFINHWRSVTQTVHSIFFAVRWFPQTLWTPLSPTPRLFVVCVSHCFDANAIMKCLAEKGISLPPCAPYNKGSEGSRPLCPRGSGAPER